MARLRDERPLEELAGSIQAYYDRSGSTETAATVALLRIEHMYYKHDSSAEAVRDAQAFRAAWGGHADIITLLVEACANRAEAASRARSAVYTDAATTAFKEATARALNPSTAGRRANRLAQLAADAAYLLNVARALNAPRPAALARLATIAAAAAAGEASNPLGGPSGSVESLLAKIEAVLVAKGSAADEEEWEVVPAAAGEVAPADVPADVPAAAGAE